MRVTGYKLRGYDATYDKTLFDIQSKEDDKSRVLEITDINSGVTFIIPMDKSAKSDRGGPIRDFCQVKGRNRGGGYQTPSSEIPKRIPEANQGFQP